MADSVAMTREYMSDVSNWCFNRKNLRLRVFRKDEKRGKKKETEDGERVKERDGRLEKKLMM